jgi:hypothetical protein
MKSNKKLFFKIACHDDDDKLNDVCSLEMDLMMMIRTNLI